MNSLNDKDDHEKGKSQKLDENMKMQKPLSIETQLKGDSVEDSKMPPSPLKQIGVYFETYRQFMMNDSLLVKNIEHKNLEMFRGNEKVGNRKEDFIIIHEIGRGATGVVYKVRSNINGRIYAMKDITVTHLKIKKQKESFKEILVLKNIQHSNIIKYSNSFFQEGHIYIIMEYAEYGDLSKVTIPTTHTKH
jgi:hypothetical protein